MTVYTVELDKELVDDRESERSKVYWITMNVVLNGLSVDDYDWLEETKNWASGTEYFPELSWEEFLEVARKYEFWPDFEEIISDQ